jgi:hypothetical protein
MSMTRTMRKSLLVSGSGMLLGSSAFGAVYTDAVGTDHYGGNEVDIASVVVTNDASNITFQINMNPAADIGVNHFANYEVGIQVGGGASGTSSTAPAASRAARSCTLIPRSVDGRRSARPRRSLRCTPARHRRPSPFR